MAKVSSHNGKRRSVRSATPARLKLFRSITWRDGTIASTDEYVVHLVRELGRLGLEISDIESHARPPHTETVLSDLIEWLTDHPGKAYAELVNWQLLDLPLMRARLQENHAAKPRIELSAEITKMNNLSVRWHPGGWSDSAFDWHQPDRHSHNLITRRAWPYPPDFHWFVGDEQPTFDSRPSNELMYIRGVGNLRPEPCDEYGSYASFNHDVVDSILICAVRSAYEGLIAQLERAFEVAVMEAFDFTTRDEVDETDQWSRAYPIHRVIGWSLEDAAELRKRREHAAAAERDRQDQAELANVTTKHGFTLEVFVAAVLQASTAKGIGPLLSAEQVNRNAAKDLRLDGFKAHAGDVRRIRELIERFDPDILPELLRPAPPPARHVATKNNVAQFPKRDE